MSQYEEIDNETQELFNEIRNEYFENLRNCNILVIFNNKPKKKSGHYILGECKKANELLKFLTADQGEGVDIIIFLDKNVFLNIEKSDQEKIIRHELRHIFSEAKGPYKIIDHDITDFYAEIEFNKDDPQWIERVNEIAASIYDKEGE